MIFQQMLSSIETILPFCPYYAILHDTSVAHLNINLRKIKNWVFQWKKSFDPEPGKQVQKTIFSSKLQKKSFFYLL